MHRFGFHRLTLQTRFVALTGFGILILAAGLVAALDWLQASSVELKLRGFSENELGSLHALVLTAMERRLDDADGVAVDVFNKWFESRNRDYPGKLWSVWSASTAAYMAREDGKRARKPPVDAVDEEALRSGGPVARFVGDAYRYSMPIILGITPGTDRESCYACHTHAMGQRKGETIAVFSSSLSTVEEFAALRRMRAWMAGGALAGGFVLLLGLRLIFDRVMRGKRRAMLRLADEFETAVGRIVDTVSASACELETAAATLTRTATTTQQLSMTVANASAEASGNVQAVAAAAEELTASVDEIGRQVQASRNIADEAVRQAQATDGRMQELTRASARIGEAMKIITAIAEQTNLLALNAAIEAAHAGAAGRGFAVVAGEVKALAVETVKATDAIGQQIAAIQGATQDSVAAIKAIAGTITRISEIATAIASAVEQQGAATGEIAHNVQHAASGTSQVAANVGEVSRGADATGTASGQVLVSARALAGEGTRLKREVAKFLATVRAA